MSIDARISAAGTMLGGAALAMLAWLGPAHAHPHVFAEARLDLQVNPDGTVKSLRNLWRFDEVFSSTVLMEFDKNGDLALDEAELDEASRTIAESIGEYGYFQIVTANGKEVKMKPPPQLMAMFDDQQLVLLFESQPISPLKLMGKIDFGIYDPTFYVSIDFVKDEDMAVANQPGNCTRKVVRPNPDEAISENQKTLTDAFFNDPTGTTMSKIFATKLELNCVPKG